MIDRLGIGPQVRAKSVLVKGGSSADRIVSGEADIAIQQISEILPVKGVGLLGRCRPRSRIDTDLCGGRGIDDQLAGPRRKP